MLNVIMLNVTEPEIELPDSLILNKMFISNFVWPNLNWQSLQNLTSLKERKSFSIKKVSVELWQGVAGCGSLAGVAEESRVQTQPYDRNLK